MEGTSFIILSYCQAGHIHRQKPASFNKKCRHLYFFPKREQVKFLTNKSATDTDIFMLLLTGILANVWLLSISKKPIPIPISSMLKPIH